MTDKKRPGRWKGTRHYQPRVDRYTVQARVSAPLLERLIEIAQEEGRTMGVTAGTLMLLGAGVWRRLCEQPELGKWHLWSYKAELLLLADMHFVEDMYALQDEAAQAYVARRKNPKLSERSKYY